MASCSYCGGAGGRYEGYMPCGRCGGSGRGGYTNVACMDCGGSGQSSSQRWVPCTACHGSGSLSDSAGSSSSQAGRQKRSQASTTSKQSSPSKSSSSTSSASQAKWTGWITLFAVLGYVISLGWLKEQGGVDVVVMMGLAIFPALLIGRYWKVLLGIVVVILFISANKS